MRIAHESNCQYFYDCLNGVKTLHQCNENLIFNPYVEACDYPIHVACIITGHVSV
ncbi:hypothetical protein WH47_08916 [Habropoda laboriosa]|uniref:Chitin-binding type-2 domain-containing protein n=2 Tax=Habropoda laboriosa TaxID=597456 RepID=A0A0L7R6Q1_9HYME|nr:hypothetical protein WH47_08916 [Habropoda laboriosa]